MQSRNAVPQPAPDDDHPFGAPAARRAWLGRDATLRALDEVTRDLIRVASDPLFPRWQEQIKAIGGCAAPIYVRGYSTVREAATGEVLHGYSTDGEPGERLAVRCGNRRAGRCPACSWWYQGDSFHLVRSGLAGGKGIPESVAAHPRLFVTLTGPSFGPVHRAADGAPCHPRRDRPVCQHGGAHSCPLIHSEDDPQVGSPLCPTCYDYTGHVLWHAHAGRLWNDFTTNVRRALALVAGVPVRRLRDHLLVSFAKVAEYQKRGAVHFHAVIRLDGHEGPDTPPPPWATAALLEQAVRRAHERGSRHVPESAAYGAFRLRWGAQVDARPIHAFGADGATLTDDAVAAYVAKYVTKAAEVAGAAEYPITSAGQIDSLPVSPHVRALVGTAWRLGGLPELAELHLRRWAHMLGYRGHALTKSRTYSTTFTALRAARQRHQAGPVLPGDPDTITEANWRYAGRGYTPGEQELAAGIANNIRVNRETAREELASDWGEVTT